MAAIHALVKYTEQKNTWRSFFGQAPLSLMSEQDRKTIAQLLESDLSPENLTCDGELRGAQLRTKVSFLNRVADELRELDPTVQLYV
jgi:hypothetical protein